MTSESDLVLKVKLLSPEAKIPQRGSPLAAGYDLASLNEITIEARSKGLVPTGISLQIPNGHYGRIAPRSSLAWTYHVDTGAGVIDSDYRGEILVLLFNHASSPLLIQKGARVAQLILEKISTPPVLVVDELEDTRRGHGGFGSTGT